MPRTVAGGRRAGWSIGTEHALYQTSSSALQQVAALIVPYTCMTRPGSTGLRHALETGQVVRVPYQGKAD